ncbi:MAG: 3-phosphoserine/phosphohydroxythreonine transaminase [Acidobacteriota bacterium]
MSQRVHNFNPGPAAMPLSVLEELRDNTVVFGKSGMSILEVSHRSKEFEAVIQSAEARLRRLLNLTDDFAVTFQQGGASLQFCMVPMNLMTANKKADYIVTGHWAKAAVKEAAKLGTVNQVGSTESENFTRLPRTDELKFDPAADYVHMTSNNTIYGTEWLRPEPEVGSVPLICDASSDFLSRPIPMSKYALVYAGAQKNAGPAGVTLVIIRKDLLARSQKTLPAMLNYNTHVEKQSLYNTPPCYSIFAVELVCKWLENLGGLAAMDKVNEEKASRLYAAIDSSEGYYRCPVAKDSRSRMNVVFRLGSEELEGRFTKGATAAGLVGLKGHRSVGGCRASLYNAVSIECVDALVQFMKDFQKANG